MRTDLPWDSFTQTQDFDSVMDGKAQITLPGATDLDTVDFGYLPVGYGSIGDYVWQDNNGNGIQDASEPALSDITVSLYLWEDDGDGILEIGERGDSLQLEVPVSLAAISLITCQLKTISLMWMKWILNCRQAMWSVQPIITIMI